MRRSRPRRRLLLLALAVALSLPPALAFAPSGAGADAPPGFATVRVLGNLTDGPGGGPTSFAYAPDGRIFIARKTGVVDVFDNGVEHTFLDIRDEVNSVQARGLVGMAIDPNFGSTGRLFLLFTEELDPAHPDEDFVDAGGEVISIKGKASDPNTADPASRVTVVTGFDSASRLHSVAGLRFDNDGHLLVGFADASDNGVNQGQALQALDLDKLNGKILRVDPTTGNGIPGNPYYDAAHPASVRSRIYARGVRNPFRFTVDPTNDNLYVGEVGWNTWEQLDVFTPTFANADRDRNGGWPCYEGGDGVALVQPEYQTSPVTASTCHTVYTKAEGGTGVGAITPLYGYRHDEVPQEVGSAIVGGPKYTGTSNYPAQYDGMLFVGDFGRDSMKTVDPVTGDATDFGTSGTWGSPVDIQIATDGNVAWLGIQSGELREIVYTGGNNHPPTAVAHSDVSSGPSAPLKVKFSSAGSSDPDGDPLTYDWDFGDGTTSTKPNPLHIFKHAGAYDVSLTVSDGHQGGVDNAALQIGVADAFPTISFTKPSPSLRYKIGDQIDVTLAAHDAEDGALSGENVQTTIIQHTGGHEFPGGNFSGLSGSFVAADLGFPDTYYELDATATDSSGLLTTVTMDVLPKTVPITVASAPEGVDVAVDGITRTTPYTFDAIVGSGHEVLAPPDFVVGEEQEAFSTWTTPGGVAINPYAAFTAPATAATVSARYDSLQDGFAVSDATVVEGDSGSRAVAVTISRSTASGAASSVKWKTANGTANGADYTKSSGTALFAAGQTSTVVTIPVIGDTQPEADEQFSVALSKPVGGIVVQPDGIVRVLNDDAGAASLRVDVGDVALLEGASATRNAAFTVSLSAPSPGGVSVHYATADGAATAPGDYTATSGTVTFAAGEVSRTVTVPVIGDRANEPTEDFGLVLSNPVGVAIGRGTGHGYIGTDDTAVIVSVSTGNFFEGDSGKPKIPFTVSLSAPSSDPVSVDWAASHITTNDADVKLASGTATIPAGQTETTVDVTTTADKTKENDESFQVVLTNPQGALIGAGTGLEIVRNDDPGTPANRVSIGDVAIAEGNSGARTAQFVITLAAPQTHTITMHYATVDGTATAGSDYTARSGTVTIPQGAVSRVISIAILGDSTHESDETFSVTLSAPSGTTISDSAGQGTIRDDD